MKKEIEFYKWYFGVIIIAMIVAVAVKEKDSIFIPVQTAQITTEKPIVDWSNIDNPEKKKYLEHLYNTTTKPLNQNKTLVNFSSHTAVRRAKLYTIPRGWE